MTSVIKTLLDRIITSLNKNSTLQGTNFLDYIQYRSETIVYFKHMAHITNDYVQQK